MRPLSAIEKFQIGLTAVGLVAAVPVWHEALKEPEKVAHAQTDTHAAVRNTLTQTARTTAKQARQKETSAPSKERHIVAHSKKSEEETDWRPHVNFCRDDSAWYCHLPMPGMSLTMFPPANLTQHNRPVTTPLPITKSYAKAPHPRAEKETAPEDDILAKMRQFQLDDMTDFFQDLTTGKTEMDWKNANVLLMLLTEMSSDARYTADILRNFGTDCRTFIDSATLLVNDYAAQFADMPDEVDAGVKPRAGYLSWRTGIANIGFEPNDNYGLTWSNPSVTLLNCPSEGVFEE